MKPSNPKDRREEPTRPSSLLFDGAKLGTTLPSPAAFAGVPKLPPGESE